ncbi:DNA-directed RNA polymeras-like proteines I and III subunit RPAC1 [Periconia macrospinosa]|uniref:DNA-directed RNA polymerases I and III subunit RPAC1 n=1 Tax=Periconia macrospinosa TaxID=97972 RepID=A0A2V1EDY2_9PLEO|nr:DNA-directed RNA polymeras-like proteines I and III subunit RPAC1 [Periconia macrospinosa]
MPEPTAEELARRNRLQILPETVSDQTSTDFPGHWPGENHEWNLEHFRKNFKVQFHSDGTAFLLEKQNHAIPKHRRIDQVFSLIGLDASIANAFRRILIAEVPTLAIEDVFIYQNTSIIQDEVFAHRLGLIPLCADRLSLHNMGWYIKPTEGESNGNELTDENCVILHLQVKCEWKEGGLEKAAKGETNPNELYVNHSVYARDLVWQKHGRQLEWPEDDPVRAVYPDILIAKMRPGQEVIMKLHAYKGIGQDHAKFSPVATASYRLLPTIDILKPIVGADAKKFADCFPPGVIGLDEVTSEDAQKHDELQGKEGELKAVVANPFNDTVSREALRHAEFKDKVKLGRVRDHFIFRVESTGQWDSDELFLQSVQLLKTKAQRIKRGLDLMMK